MPAVSAPSPHRIDLGDLSPIEVASALGHLPGLVFFDSALESSAEPVSIIAAAPTEILRGHIDRDWETLRAAIRARSIGSAPDLGLPLGFAAGCVEYDGAFHFGLYEHALYYRHRTGEWSELGGLSRQLRSSSSSSSSSIAFRSESTPADYIASVRRAQEYIAAGDIYQVNLAHRFTAEYAGSPFALYEALRHHSPAPYAAYLDLGDKQIPSSSPESFLRLSGRHARTRPIKGTRPRRADHDADEKSAYDLITSPKELAELLMITDLERNDLGIFSEWGSVIVRELLALERYEQVFHLVSTIESTLRSDVDHATAFRHCFPGGSITGAPKKRAREIIAELEPTPRGVYTGALGWFGFNEE
ncbi:MAG TPA: chorismate-binding protein, partial [Chthoniobacteraceae bacterium]|nr:chorismate-binding protein [Chthoniobacteraceae bacterium]